MNPVRPAARTSFALYVNTRDFRLSQLTLGSFRITRIQAGTYYPDGGCLFGVVPKDRWAGILPPNDANRIPLSLNCYVVETGDHTVLVETGGGIGVDPNAPTTGGLVAPLSLPELLDGAGLDPSKVDVVINSHLHWDHCGGNTTSRGGRIAAAFPQARYYCAQGEWEHARELHPRDSVSYDSRNFAPLLRSGQMELISGDCEPVPGVRMHSAPGHNRDLQIVTAESAGRTFCFFSDLVPTAAHLQPGWIAAFDLFPLESLASKMKWLARAASERWICGFSHDPRVGFAVIDKHYSVVEDLTGTVR